MTTNYVIRIRSDNHSEKNDIRVKKQKKKHEVSPQTDKSDHTY